MLLFVFVSALLSFCAAFFTRRLAFKVQAIDAVQGGRKIHTKPTALLGGLGIGLTILFVAVGTIVMHPGVFDEVFLLRIGGFLAGIILLLIGGSLDDRYNLKPWMQICFPIAAAFCVMATGTSILEISSLAGKGVWSLDWWHASTTLFGHALRFVFPADLLTLAWLLGVTYATKTMDGIDGLVTGQTVIGILLIILLALSPRFYQPEIVVIAAIILGAFAGFLPWNISPARQFLGESGSTLAGFSLGFLAIVSGAKVATAFMALGIPLVDFLRVILRRIHAGRSPFQGDDTHLHFQLLHLQFTPRQVAAFFWMLTLIFGLSALGLQTRGKTFLIIGLIAITLVLALGAARVRSSISLTWRKRFLLFMALMTCIVAMWSIRGLWREYVRSSEMHTIQLQSKPLFLEIADTPQAREQGLSDRPSLRTDHGMLFVFPKPDRYTFWMPRMQFDLDIVWLNGSRIVDVVRLPAPTLVQEVPARHTPAEPADRVLELVAGQAAVHGFVKGAIVPQLEIGTAKDNE